ncbi:POK9 protein, partial [Ceuthmochares aereus]|nr:POK9 protein [Ceuthmochares aereus]
KLHATVNECGLHGEPTKQMINYLWSTNLLLPEDIRNVAKLIMTRSQFYRGSLGMDVAAAVDFTLVDTQPQCIPTEIKGPILINGIAVGALLLGRSSAAMNGLTVITGLIDADYVGEIQIMVQTLFLPMVIPKGMRIAQLVPLPMLTTSLSFLLPRRQGEGGFGSTGEAAFLTLDLKRRPQHYIKIIYQEQTLELKALLDTGADVTIIDSAVWPRTWPATCSDGGIEGVGGMTLAHKS